MSAGLLAYTRVPFGLHDVTFLCVCGYRHAMLVRGFACCSCASRDDNSTGVELWDARVTGQRALTVCVQICKT